jgi:hypothetical protein
MREIEEASFFPEELLSKAEVRAESAELLWKLPDMISVIDTLERNRKIILGLDVFAREAGFLRVLGYPDFSEDLGKIADHNKRVLAAADMARDFIRAQKDFDQLRLSITWDHA